MVLEKKGSVCSGGFAPGEEGIFQLSPGAGMQRMFFLVQVQLCLEVAFAPRVVDGLWQCYLMQLWERRDLECSGY
jgi:hypothetical protein